MRICRDISPTPPDPIPAFGAHAHGGRRMGMRAALGAAADMQPTVRRQVGCQQAGQSQRVTGGLHAAGGADARRHAQPRIRRFGDPRFILGSPSVALQQHGPPRRQPQRRQLRQPRPRRGAESPPRRGHPGHPWRQHGPPCERMGPGIGLHPRRKFACEPAPLRHPGRHAPRSARTLSALGKPCRQRHGFLGRTLQRHRHAIRAAVGSHERPAVLRHFDAHVGAGLAQIGALTQIDGKAELGW